MTDHLNVELANEAQRIEEDSEHSAKSHYNAASRWGKYHLWIGLPSAITAAFAGGSAFNNMPNLAGSLAIISTALTTLITFLNPSKRAEAHKTFGGQYLTLRNQARVFRNIELSDGVDMTRAKKKILELSQRKDELNQNSLIIPRKDYELAKKDIDEGRSKYRADEESK